VALDFGEMRHIETSGWPGRALADDLDFFVARNRLASPALSKSQINQGGRGRLFLCKELSA
jgi:hypothetical protein